MLKKQSILILLILLLVPILIGAGQCGKSAENQICNKEVTSMVTERKQGDYTLRVDVTNQKLELDIPKEKDYGNETGNVETKIYPDLKELVEYNSFLSASIISAKAKQFDDGLYGAVEIACENGEGKFSGKKKFLSVILKTLQAMSGEEAKANLAFISAAAELGGEKVELKDEDILKLSEKIKSDFLGNDLRSKPIGFYTWNEDLKKIFQQDRLLQSELDYPDLMAQAIVKANEKDYYKNYLYLIGKMTNPLIKEVKDLTSLCNGEKASGGDKFVLFPPSQAYETELVKKLFSGKSIPENFNLAEKLIEEIKSGKIDITPKENSGWYDYQTYALEPLVMPDKFPEAKKVVFTESYKKELLELFKSLLALTRETHIKQLEVPAVGAGFPDNNEDKKPTFDIYPELSLEPLATYYLRRARAYNFIHNLLLDTFGKEGLNNMHRLTQEGPVKKSLEEELSDMEALFYGSALITASEIGCNIDVNDKDGSGRGIKADKNFAEEFMKNLSSDGDLIKDSRMMVPVFFDLERRKTKVWVFLGYEKKKLTITFANNPDVTVFDKDGKKLSENDVKLSFHDTFKELVYPVFAEIYVSKILNREEFRSLCDKYNTRTEILKALEK